MSTAVDVLLGVLYGDCLGAPYEFHSGPVTSPITVGPSVFGHPAGRGTDDTETTIAVAEGLVAADQSDRGATRAIAERLLAWYQSHPPDVGGTTASGLVAFDSSGDPRVGATSEHSVANGSLMRSAPLALMRGDGSDLAVDSSRTTHAHQQVLGCVRAYVRMLQMILNGDQRSSHQISDLAEVDLDLHPNVAPADAPCPASATRRTLLILLVGRRRKRPASPVVSRRSFGSAGTPTPTQRSVAPYWLVGSASPSS